MKDYVDNKIFNIGINTVWYKDFITSDNEPHKYVTRTVDRLINVYKQNTINNKKSNDYDVFTNNLVCGCKFEHVTDDILFRSYDIDTICHKHILIKIIDIVKNATVGLKFKHNIKNGKDNIKNKRTYHESHNNRKK